MPPDHSLRRQALVLLTLAAGLALTLLWWFDRGRAVGLPELAMPRLPCVSYAPFRRPGQSPFDAAAHVPIESIEQDLRILRTRTNCIRTYAVNQGLDAVPAVAARLGMRVKLGAWIGRDAAANAAELDRAIALTREHSGVIDLLVVGNEVLLRGELAPQALSALLVRARRESAVPVSYADVWEFWSRNAALRAHVDVVTIHVLPYWEDEPVAVEHAVDHVLAVAAQMKQRFAGAPVWIGETGWPAAGRQRGGAVPGRLEQARFVRELAARAQREPLDFNLIEGFDQPWKRSLEGAMGGAWGLFDSAGAERVRWSGPIERDPAWRHGPLAAAAAGVVAAVAGLARWRSVLAAAALGLAWAAIAAIGVAQWQAMWIWNRTPAEWALSAIANAAAVLCALLCALLCAGRIAAAAAPRPVPTQPVPGIARSLLGRPVAGRALGLSRAVVLFAAAAVALQLVFDGRYREFASPLLAAPALLLLALRLAGERLDAGAREERVLAGVIAVCAPLIVLLEGLHNGQAIVFALLLLVLGGASGWPHRGASLRAAPSPGRPATDAPRGP